MNDCLFCSIAQGDSLVWQSQDFAAFNDIHPKAKTHVLIVPKQHVDSLDHLDAQADGGPLLEAVQQVAKHLGVSGGYRAQINVGRTGGQEIDHLHDICWPTNYGLPKVGGSGTITELINLLGASTCCKYPAKTTANPSRT